MYSLVYTLPIRFIFFLSLSVIWFLYAFFALYILHNLFAILNYCALCTCSAVSLASIPISVIHNVYNCNTQHTTKTKTAIVHIWTVAPRNTIKTSYSKNLHVICSLLPVSESEYLKIMTSQYIFTVLREEKKLKKKKTKS